MVSVIFPNKKEVEIFGDYFLVTEGNFDGGFDVLLNGNLCGQFSDEADADAFEAVLRTEIDAKLADGGTTVVTIDELRSR